MTEVGKIYGQALYDLAQAEQLTDVILPQLTALEDSFQQEPDFLRLLNGHALSKQEKCDLLDNSFRDKLHLYVLNFLKLLTEKGYAKYFPDCCAAFRAQYHLEHNILPVTAITATPLTQGQSARLQEKLKALTGKNIELHNRIDPEVLGGVRLDYDGKRLDDTVSNRLDAIRRKLSGAEL